MKEIEIKVLEIDVPVMTKKLIALGAKKISDSKIVSSYLDFPDRSLNKRGIVLRVRKGDKNYLTMKRKISQKTAKVAEETELEISDPKKLLEILKQIGLKEISHGTRRRVTYKLKHAHFDIDFYPEIPPCMEIEASTEARLRELIQQLNIPKSKIRTWNGKQLLAHYKKS